MLEKELRSLLEDLQSGRTGIDDVVNALGNLPFEDLGFAKVDHHRGLRCGQSEVIFCEGKTPSQVAVIAESILSKSDMLLATRATDEHFRAVSGKCPGAWYSEEARCIVYSRTPVELRGNVTVICAGTTDIPVAAEAKVTAETLGAKAQLISDVGVAGLHRLLRYSEEIRKANVTVVAAGMEGALPSVVGGMTGGPVIAVPTSVGYGTSLRGVAPLLTMLNSCAAGIAVVNIDNGFGAGYLAAKINALAVGSEI